MRTLTSLLVLCLFELSPCCAQTNAQNITQVDAIRKLIEITDGVMTSHIKIMTNNFVMREIRCKSEKDKNACDKHFFDANADRNNELILLIEQKALLEAALALPDQRAGLMQEYSELRRRQRELDSR
jgi:hypothetical protein